MSATNGGGGGEVSRRLSSFEKLLAILKTVQDRCTDFASKGDKPGCGVDDKCKKNGHTVLCFGSSPSPSLPLALTLAMKVTGPSLEGAVLLLYLN